MTRPAISQLKIRCKITPAGRWKVTPRWKFKPQGVNFQQGKKGGGVNFQRWNETHM